MQPGYTFNPWIGCSKVSQGCKFCYAETLNRRYHWAPEGWGPFAARKLTSPANWAKPLQWAAQARATGTIRRVFCASLADVFDPDVPTPWRERLWRLIEAAAAPQGEEPGWVGLEWLLLTKRPERIAQMLPRQWLARPPAFLRLGVTAEDQPNANRRMGELFSVWRGKNFVSYEPALGPLDFQHLTIAAGSGGYFAYNALTGEHWPFTDRPVRGLALQWAIVGGESGAGCRPMDVSWARSVVEQCRQAGVPVFVKQLGGFPNKRDHMAEWPEELRVQERPEV